MLKNAFRIAIANTCLRPGRCLAYEQAGP